MLCRGAEGELARMPDDGGVARQSAFVMAAFNVLAQAEADYRDWRKGLSGV